MRSSHVDLFLSRAASMQAPFYREFPPAPDLYPLVACIWIRVVKNADAVREPILPDGCADIMIYGDQPPRVAGPDAVTRYVRLPDGLVITGIRLRPGAIRAALGVPADLLVNGSMQLSDLSSGATRLHHRLMLTDNLPARIALLEDWVRAAAEQVNERDRAVVAACRALAGDSKIAIASVAERLEWNARMLHRQFLAACGYSPKHFQRIMRIQHVLRSAHGGRDASLSELAIAAGFADQAHMTRDFRAITRFTPAEYFAGAARPGWGAWINEDW
jgi:AraC-like DNA-binding protein